MAPLDVALKYMDIFFSGRELERLREILADDLVFSGPLYQFDSSRAYLESLQSAPPVDCSYKIVQAFENGPLVNLIYEFSKPSLRTHMSQLFEIRHDKIASMLLIFDTRKFA